MSRSRERGVPIVFEGGSYRLEEGKAFEVPGFWFKADELAALLGLAHWLETLGCGVLEEKLKPIHHRMEELLLQQDLQTIDWKNRIRLLPTHHRPINSDILLSAARAVLTRNQATFQYTGIKDSKPHKRTVSPQTLVHYRDNWYLDSFDHDSGKLREFALSRMKSFQVIPIPAKDIVREVLDSHFGDAYGIFAGRAKRRAVLIFDGLAARLAGEECWHPKQRTRLMHGGRVRLEFPCGSIHELARDVMRFADEVSIERPDELRQEVAGMLLRARSRLEPKLKTV